MLAELYQDAEKPRFWRILRPGGSHDRPVRPPVLPENFVGPGFFAQRRRRRQTQSWFGYPGGRCSRSTHSSWSTPVSGSPPDSRMSAGKMSSSDASPDFRFKEIARLCATRKSQARTELSALFCRPTLDEDARRSHAPRLLPFLD